MCVLLSVCVMEEEGQRDERREEGAKKMSWDLKMRRTRDARRQNDRENRKREKAMSGKGGRERTRRHCQGREAISVKGGREGRGRQKEERDAM